MPYKQLQSGNVAAVEQYVAAYRKNCPVTLKVIIESGELSDAEIKKAAEICIVNEVDFIKTSTGKAALGATINATEIILNSILVNKSQDKVGIKLSGGIRTIEQANEYLELIEKVFGSSWISNKHVRFGASSLLEDIKKAYVLLHKPQSVFSSYC